MSTDVKKFFLAARRELDDNGAVLVLVDPWTGERHLMNESQLRDTYSIGLGDFMHAYVDPMKILYKISKTEHTARLWTKVDGNVAFVENVLSHLNLVKGELLFQNKLFGDSLCSDKSLAPGDYKIKIHLLETPHQLSNGRKVHFQGTDAEPRVPKPTIGAGFPAAPKKDGKFIGAGFQSASKNEDLVEMRAVVLSSIAKPIGTHYYVWNVDSRTEALFVSKEHDLQQGHFFVGVFKKKPDGRMTCQRYEKPIEQLFEGGLTDKNKIYFTVKIDNYQPAEGNSKYASAFAKYFGNVLEGDTEGTKLSTESNGKMVNIQRRRIGEKDFVWMITE
ncbi:hypothetical protein CAEBREN_23982 [Caenorhabditis brenneri]|uniref:Uncharacterized protein n=1 Tax=Caenorhabditis brenneri TaxID=135651 RepID=G0NW31_CAEBE|nr:hypothetical protein CAEBREN_23982 [Caenorhabditis brenneri]